MLINIPFLADNRFIIFFLFPQKINCLITLTGTLLLQEKYLAVMTVNIVYVLKFCTPKCLT